jgi:hypothetical protein
MPESSHRLALSAVEGDVKLRAGIAPESSTCTTGQLPSLALDTGFQAGMTGITWALAAVVYNDED